MILAIDPGREKCGMAVMDRAGRVVWRGIVPRREAALQANRLREQHGVKWVLLGKGTGATDLQQELAAAGVGEPACRILPVEEKGTTEEARRRYFQENPPRGWRRLLPRGLLVPPEPVDDWAAVILAERYLHLGGEPGVPREGLEGR